MVHFQAWDRSFQSVVGRSHRFQLDLNGMSIGPRMAAAIEYSDGGDGAQIERASGQRC